ncbi:8-oxo-dGTP diphosphatase MutT [Glaciecola sp. MH2013]|uniref:8-oxo-dGTP diphosphatase MutT n=1 Tax=Glaciecola sp. MH2013 TaxID=2785524 RepID=UPI0018A023B7|nr:8-oxo-dGTP diphosphatase MutT [Glaciecola sp. MH2013]MBF7072053.1 8-oxo-dGTP diphosphatase MutT [Glaciecola sp. MH2013]
MKQIHVAVGVVKKDSKYFVCKRAAHQHQGGKWEFPGGKVERGESVEQALKRELEEEIGIALTHSSPLIEIAHEYPDKHVLLSVLLVDSFDGQPYGKEGQIHSWVSQAELEELDFPEANKAIVAKLRS